MYVYLPFKVLMCSNVHLAVDHLGFSHARVRRLQKSSS